MAQIKRACPLGLNCESCGHPKRLRVRIVRWRGIGAACMTLCPGCASAKVPPSLTVGTRDRLIAAHREHSAAGGAR